MEIEVGLSFVCFGEMGKLRVLLIIVAALNVWAVFGRKSCDSDGEMFLIVRDHCGDDSIQQSSFCSVVRSSTQRPEELGGEVVQDEL